MSRTDVQLARKAARFTPVNPDRPVSDPQRFLIAKLLRTKATNVKAVRPATYGEADGIIKALAALPARAAKVVPATPAKTVRAYSNEGVIPAPARVEAPAIIAAPVERTLPARHRSSAVVTRSIATGEVIAKPRVRTTVRKDAVLDALLGVDADPAAILAAVRAVRAI